MIAIVFLVGFVLGAIFGAVIVALMANSAQISREEEQRYLDNL